MRFLFDTSVLIDYLRDPNDVAADALFIAAKRGEVCVTLISLMELYLPRNKSDHEINEELRALQELCKRLSIRIILSSRVSQQKALEVLKAHRSLLGRSALPDSLILSAGITRQAYLVTKDANWFRINNKTLSPEDLVRRF